MSYKTRCAALMIHLDVVQMSLRSCQSLLCSKGSCLLCFVTGVVGT
ncbi:hypothetical protein MtrunA17_Chr5g0413691 [Medicago truncatula]|uniref:Uncharacterized protein n=1 Tax=Medicago truncatula TaxID=3880 RepID=A0A396HR63_MEDTR|nr:hypothetical protein MtrunA17_Chr5g0413691 [Medicago truncatula]